MKRISAIVMVPTRLFMNHFGRFKNHNREHSKGYLMNKVSAPKR